jgi:hypothetical protein
VAQLLEFPSQRVQGLAFLEDQIRELLAARGADEELIDFAANTVRDVYQRNIEAENYSFSVELPPTISEQDAESLRGGIELGIKQIRDENHAIIVRLIAELVLAEVKLFQHRRQDD